MVNWFEFLAGFVSGACVASWIAAYLDGIRCEEIDELRDELAGRAGADDLA